ncbi:LPS translocon maturation chaperone LptM [Shewanella gaetbuli]
MRLLLLLLLASLSITACGQKGALYKSPDPQSNQSAEPAEEQGSKVNEVDPVTTDEQQ